MKNKIISLIQMTIIYYLSILFENIHIQIDEYNNNKIINNHSKLYQTEIFKFISILDSENIQNNSNFISPFIEITNQLIDKINSELIGQEDHFNFFNDNDFINSFKKINKKKLEIYEKK